MKKSLLLVCLLAASLTASAQFVTSGVVVDAAGNPVSGARVEAKGTDAFVTTGIDGRFTLETNRMVEKVKVRSAGHLPKKQNVSANMTIALENDNWWSRPATRYQFFVSPQVTIPSLDGKDVPFGIMVGVVKNFGAYVRYVQSKMPSTSKEFKAQESYDRADYYYWTDKKTGYQAITGGAIIRLGCPLYATVGAGYVHRKVAMQHITGDWYELPEKVHNDFYSHSGICAEVGLMMKIGHIAINGGTVLWHPEAPFFGANFGVGYVF
ncbi:MAG: carboxypeptidase regulatory-like domain-containing protein [Prevotella sp.]|nr:carboxypeptidase regulatory-like domain-containing protein [Prevotella sp.]